MRTSSTLYRITRCSAEWRCAFYVAAMTLFMTVPSIASATCGDYVLVRDAAGRLVPASQLASPQHAPMRTADQLPAPCRGPTCSGRPDVPPAAPVVPFNWPVAPEGLLVQVGGSGEHPRGDCRQLSGGPVHPIHHPGHIFRPPRS